MACVVRQSEDKDVSMNELVYVAVESDRVGEYEVSLYPLSV